MTRSGYKKDKDFLELIQCSATKVIEGLEHVSCMEIVKELGVFSLEKVQGIISMCTNIGKEAVKKAEPDSSQWHSVTGVSQWGGLVLILCCQGSMVPHWPGELPAVCPIEP